MKNFKKIMFFSFLLGIGITAKSQEAIVSAGGDAMGTGGNVSYSIGLLKYDTKSNSTGTVSQGVQHGYELFAVGINETKLNVSLSVFPNPSSDFLTLNISDYQNQKLQYQLFDMQVKLIESGSIYSKQTKINVSGLPVGTYFINLMQDNKKVQTYKVVKN